VLLAPAILWAFRYRDRRLADPELAAGTVLVVTTITFAIDCLANAMFNPLYLVIIGGLIIPCRLQPKPRRAPKPMRVPPPPYGYEQLAHESQPGQ